MADVFNVDGRAFDSLPPSDIPPTGSDGGRAFWTFGGGTRVYDLRVSPTGQLAGYTSTGIPFTAAASARPGASMNVDTGLIEYADPMQNALANMGFGLGSSVAGMADMIFEGEIGGGALVPTGGSSGSSEPPPVLEGAVIHASAMPAVSPWLVIAIVVVIVLMLGDN
jgi:hypothetical protein